MVTFRWIRFSVFSLLLLLGSVAFAGNPPGHWSYPGDIRSHLERSHGISTSGMTYQQMLNAHDADHWSTRGRSTRTVRSVRSQPSVRIFRWFR